MQTEAGHCHIHARGEAGPTEKMRRDHNTVIGPPEPGNRIAQRQGAESSTDLYLFDLHYLFWR